MNMQDRVNRNIKLVAACLNSLPAEDFIELYNNCCDMYNFNGSYICDANTATPELMANRDTEHFDLTDRYAYDNGMCLVSFNDPHDVFTREELEDIAEYLLEWDDNMSCEQVDAVFEQIDREQGEGFEW